MLVRVRTRDGTEKVALEESATVGALRALLELQFKVPYADQTLSMDPQLLLAPDAAAFRDLADPTASLRAHGVSHGSLLYLRYTVQREVTPSQGVDTRPYGSCMTIADMVLKQTRIERQETPRCASLSFDGQAANVFQAYINQALSFSIQRAGFLYGEIDAEGNVKAHFIYEPPQQGASDGVVIQTNEEEQRRVDVIAERLGMTCVGWIFSASTAVERDYILSSKEILHMAALQAAGGEFFATAVVSLVADEEGTTSVHFEAFQCSQQAVKLYSEGWLVPGNDMKFVATNLEKDVVIVAGRDARKIENEFLVTVVPILDHTGPLQTSFPVENRLTGQTQDELRACLTAAKAKPYAQRLADFHLLLYLGGFLEASDIALLSTAVREGGVVSEGYTLLISALAGM